MSSVQVLLDQLDSVEDKGAVDLFVPFQVAWLGQGFYNPPTISKKEQIF